jgi:hypothetical protein
MARSRRGVARVCSVRHAFGIADQKEARAVGAWWMHGAPLQASGEFRGEQDRTGFQGRWKGRLFLRACRGMEFN